MVDQVERFVLFKDSKLVASFRTDEDAFEYVKRIDNDIRYIIADNEISINGNWKLQKCPYYSSMIKRASDKERISPFNLFMQEEILRIKKENPSIDHKEAFKMAAHNWQGENEKI